MRETSTSPGPRKRGDPCSGHHSDPGNLFSNDLALPRVDTCADLELELASAVDDSLRTGDRAGGTVEAAEETISRRVDLDAPVESELTTNSTMVRLQHLTPSPVSQ